MPVQAFPLEQESHPGWSVAARPRPEDYEAVERALAAGSGRVFFQVPPSFGGPLRRTLTGRGVTRRLGESPEMLFLVWSRD
jgi:hypothetical protein